MLGRQKKHATISRTAALRTIAMREVRQVQTTDYVRLGDLRGTALRQRAYVWTRENAVRTSTVSVRTH